jgi:nucleoside-diphosphate-sugar epimerase
VPDTTRIRNAVGWQPKTRLDETLRIIVEHYRQQMGNTA